MPLLDPPWLPRTSLLVLSLLSLFAACSTEVTAVDASPDAAGTASDSGTVTTDAGLGSPDASPDAGAPEDAASPDANPDAAAPDTGPTTVQWEGVDLPPTLERWGATVVPLGDGQYYLFGGFEMVRGNLATSNDLMLMDMRGDAPVISEVATTSTPPARSRACAAYDPVGQRLILRGGRASGRALSDGTTWALDTRTLTWSVVQTETAPPGLVGCAMTYVASERALYHFGGAYDQPRFDWSDELWRFDLETNQWSRVTVQGELPLKAYDMTLAAQGDTLFLFGGGVGVHGNGEFRSELHTLDLTEGRWTRLGVDRVQPEGRRGHWMLVSSDGQSILIGGGESVEFALDDIWLYDRARSAWEDLTPEGGDMRPIAQGPFATALPGPGEATISIYSGMGDLTTAVPSSQAWLLRVSGVSF